MARRALGHLDPATGNVYEYVLSGCVGGISAIYDVHEDRDDHDANGVLSI